MAANSYALTIAALALFLASGGCMPVEAVHCPIGMQSRLVAELLFGRNVGEELGVREEDWEEFAATVIAREFPDGFTVLDAEGRWRDARGVTIREASKVLLVTLPEPGGIARLERVEAAYRSRFDQESVGRILRPACVSF